MSKYPFRTAPMEHQRKSLRESYGRRFFARFWEMRTGKTKVSIDEAFAMHMQGKLRGVLVLAPKGLYMQWPREELPKHAPFDYREITWQASNTKRFAKEREASLTESVNEKNLSWLFMNIEALSTGERAFGFATAWTSCYSPFMVVVDESFDIKNPESKRSEKATALAEFASYTRILDGDPIAGKPENLFGQCEFLQPGLMGSSIYSYRARFCDVKEFEYGRKSPNPEQEIWLEKIEHWKRENPGTALPQNLVVKMVQIQEELRGEIYRKTIGFKNLSELKQRLSKFSDRYTTAECYDLPEKVYQRRDAHLTTEQGKAYAALKREFKLEVKGEEVKVQHALTRVLRLLQICAGFKAHEGELELVPTGKDKELLAVLDQICGKAIIATHHRACIEHVTEGLRTVYGQLAVESYYGDTKESDRPLIVKQFQDPESPLRFLVMNPQTGGRGLTLSQAEAIIFYTQPPSLQLRNQTEARPTDPSGKMPAKAVVDLVAPGTVEERVLKAHRAGKELGDAILEDLGKGGWL